ncbi:glycosyltransferase family 4 protein [Amylibacter sp.]|jgi:glycosyltransferase involved in cell wall biosynthesis|nr:glycosyltransferase family 4 protein [Amylibacter sp.]
MHILITGNAAWNILNFRRAIVETMIADGHSVTVLVPFDKSVTELELLGCKVLHLKMCVKGLSPLRDLKLISHMRQVFRTEKPDAIFSYTIKNNIFGALAVRPLGIPFIPNVTGLGTAFLSGGFLQLIAECLYNLAFRKLNIIFLQNEDDKKLFIKKKIITSHQAKLLPGSGIDLNHFMAMDYPIENNALTFLMISRLLGDKGVFEFIAAARKVRVDHPLVRFQLLGPIDSGNRKAIDLATVKSWEAEGVIEYLGASDDVRPYITAAHCVVLPSYREGAPRSLIEAAAMSRPLIATDVPGCRSVVDDEKTGFLCRVRDEEDLVNSIYDFLRLSPYDRACMGRLGRIKMIRSFDQAIVVKAYQNALASELMLLD